LVVTTPCTLDNDTEGVKEKDKISSGPGKPPESYPLERPDPRVIAFDLRRMGRGGDRDSEETKKQQCQVEASPLTVEFGVSGV
jgi:hypothetical protein